MSPSEPTGRRDFVRALALGAIAAPAVAADDPKPTTKDAPKPDPTNPTKATSEADARMALIVARFGHLPGLDDAARATVRAEVAGIVRRGEALRKIPLSNGDGPFPVFHPYRAPLD